VEASPIDQFAIYQKVPCYATPRAFIAGAAAFCALGVERSEFFTMRAASGFSHSKAMNAAIRSQTIIAQKTLVQEPVFSNNQAAPGAANSVAKPLAV
jgi:hypothetical protein